MPTFAWRGYALSQSLRLAVLAAIVTGLTACGGGSSGDNSPSDNIPVTTDSSGMGTSGTDTSGTGTSDTGTSGTGTSDTGTSDTGTSDTGASGTGTSGTGTSGTDTTGTVPATQTKITLRWEPPLSKVDGSVLTDLAGYRIHWGTAPGVYTQTLNVADPNASSITMNKPAAGTYYFAASAYDSAANEGPYSNVASIVIN